MPGSSASGAGADGAGEGDDADAGLEYGYEIPADPANTASAYFRLGARLGELEADVGDRLDRAASGEAPVPAELVRPSPSVRST